MKTLDNDKELRKLLKEVQVETPSKEFTLKVMNRVWEEKAALAKSETVKSEKILGRGFWIILGVFILLFFAVAFFANQGIAETGQISKFIEGIGEGSVSNQYQSVFSKVNSLPLSIGGILLALSVLIFIDRFLNKLNGKIIPGKA